MALWSRVSLVTWLSLVGACGEYVTPQGDDAGVPPREAGIDTGAPLLDASLGPEDASADSAPSDAGLADAGADAGTVLGPAPTNGSALFASVGEAAFAVPPGVTTLWVKMWAAGGGGSLGNVGGGGGYVGARITVPVGVTSLTVGVGQFGRYSSGGGMSYLASGSTYLMVAGAGGGAGIDGDIGRYNATGNGAGGAGGGGTGGDAQIPGYGSGVGGSGGTQTAGGVGGTFSACTACKAGAAGTSGAGGAGGGAAAAGSGGETWRRGAQSLNGSGGGGGAGYFGGGGGAGRSTYWGAGGGGGSSYVAPTYVIASEMVSATGATPGNASDPLRPAGAAVGGSKGTTGNADSGFVYIAW